MFYANKNTSSLLFQCHGINCVLLNSRGGCVCACESCCIKPLSSFRCKESVQRNVGRCTGTIKSKMGLCKLLPWIFCHCSQERVYISHHIIIHSVSTEHIKCYLDKVYSIQEKDTFKNFYSCHHIIYHFSALGKQIFRSYDGSVHFRLGMPKKIQICNQSLDALHSLLPPFSALPF